MNLDDAYLEHINNMMAPSPTLAAPPPQDAEPVPIEQVEPPVEAPKAEPPKPGEFHKDMSVFDYLGTVARTVADTPDALVRGAVEGLGETVYAAGLVDEQQINSFRSLMKDMEGLRDVSGVNPTASGLFEDVGQILPSAIPAFKGLRAIGVSRPAAAIIAEGIGGALGYNPDDPNLVNIAQQYVGKDGQGLLSQAMRMLATNPEDPDKVNRARNFAQDAGIGSVFEGALKLIQRSPDMGKAALQWFTDTARSAQQGTAFSGIPTRPDVPGGAPMEPAPVFYSAVANAVDALPMEKGNAAQMRAMIAKSAEVKPEEMAWIGLDDFLKGKKSVTKQEIKDFVDANQVRIEEVVKQDSRVAFSIDEHRNRLENMNDEQLITEASDEFGVDPNDIREAMQDGTMSRDEYIEEILMEIETSLASRGIDDAGRLPGSNTKFSDYTLPGGENYREVLLRLPERKVDMSYDADRLKQLENEYYGLKEHAIDDPNFGEEKYNEMIKLMNIRDNSTTSSLYAEADDAMRAGQIAQSKGNNAEAESYFKLHELLNTRAEKLDLEGLGVPEPARFTGGHYDESNVLAHMRLNDRTGPNGEKILFVEEIQSDWHQKGRKHGYKNYEFGPDDVVTSPVLPSSWEIVPARQFDDGTGNIPEDILEKISPDGYVIVDTRTDNVAYGETRVDAVRDYYTKSDRPVPNDIPFVTLDSGKEVPDAPFKKTWHEMSFRRIARMAAEEGYDAIAWTPGKLQAERYDLSTQVDAIEVIPEGKNQVEIMVKAKGEDSYKTLATNVPESNIADYIGKDLAEKAMRQIGDNSADYNALSREFDAFKKRIRDGEILSDADGDRMNEVDRLLDLPTEAASLKGVDLQVGGEGMKGFYDKMLKGYAAKWGKKFGAKVGVTEIESKGAKGGVYFEAQGVAIKDPRNDIQYGDRLPPDTDLVEYWGNFGVKPEVVKSALESMEKDKGSKVWTLPITKKMRDSVLSKGVATFGAAGVAAGVNNQEARP